MHLQHSRTVIRRAAILSTKPAPVSAACTSRLRDAAVRHFESARPVLSIAYLQCHSQKPRLVHTISSQVEMAKANQPRLSARQRLDELRTLMKSHGMTAYVVPTADAHNSEYVCEHDKRRAYISDFDGSAGTAVITLDDARLWTDGRYFLQANAQLDTSAGWGLMKDRLKETPTIEAWLASTLPAGSVVGIDPSTMTIGAVRRMREKLSEAGVSLSTAPHANLVDQVWAREEAVKQPPMPSAPLKVHPLAYAGKSVSDKLSEVRASMSGEKATALVVSALDEVMWLFNIRGGDVECNPVAMAYGLVTSDTAVLCVDGAKLTPEVSAHLSASGVSVAPYSAIHELVQQQAAKDKAKVWLDPNSCSWEIYQAAVGVDAASAAKPPACVLDSKSSPLTLMKSLKNSAELEGMRQAHIRDGVGLVTFLAWLDAAVTRRVDLRFEGGKALSDAEYSSLMTEDSISEVLTAFRAQQQGFVMPSFETIAGYGPNGAIIHYRPQAGSSATIGTDQVFLLDSGGQYADGTTDVTRTMHFGQPSNKEKYCYTAVLKGHVALATAKFPAGASGIALDAIARSPLWAAGLDYRHGTGHGVGAFLNVHEGPQGLATVARSSYDGGMQAGMTISNEPGYYEDGRFGIRIETVMVAREAEVPAPKDCFGGKAYLEFETLTVTPMSTRLVEPSLLTDKERSWLNGYNQRCLTVLTPLLKDQWAKDFLARETAPV